MRSIIVAIAASLGALGPACDKSPEDAFQESKVKLAKLAVDQLARAAGPQWMVAHPTKECPDSLLDLAEFVGKTQQDTIDPWGTPYEMICGKAKVPPGTKGTLAVLSYGPDKKKGTADDVKSWEP